MAHRNIEAHNRKYALHVGVRGRIVLPAGVRKQAGIKEGDSLLLTVEEDGSLRLIDARQVAQQACGMFQHVVSPERSGVDEFIAARRKETAREDP